MRDRIIGREAELDLVAGFLTSLAQGPGTLVIAGQAGIGKTTLWQESVERARAASFVVLSARPAEAETAMAFAALADLLDPVIDRVLPDLPEPQRRALAVALLREDAGAEPLDPRAVSVATTSVLRALGQAAKVVLAVDDVQWLDLPSAKVLRFALRRVGDLCVGLIAAQRVGEGSGLPPSAQLAVAGERLTRLDLAPLNRAAMDELVEAHLGRSLGRRLNAYIQAASGGNPLYALELARALPEDASTRAGPLPVPARLRELVEARVRALPSHARAALLAAAALRSPDVERVRGASAATDEEWRSTLAHLEANAILAVEGPRLRFGHPVFAAVVYATAAAAERRRVHRRLASLTEDIEEQALHLARGAEGPNADLALDLERAADRARARGAPESAVELMDWARSLTPAGHALDLQRRSVQAAEYRFHAGDLRAARDLLESVLEEAPRGRGRADALRLLGEIRYHEESFPEAVDLLVEALDQAGEDARIAAAIELRLSLCFRALGEFERAEPHARRALELAERLGEGPILAEALAVQARLQVLLGRGLDESMLARALELEDPQRQVAMQLRPSKIAGDVLLYVGELERAVRILEGERERVLERGEENDLPYVLGHLTWAECWRGELAKAAAHAQESLDVASRVGGPAVQSMALVFAALVAAHQGDRVATRSWAEQGISLARSAGWHTPLVWGSWALGALAVSVEDFPAVDAVLGDLTAEVERQGLAEPVRAMFLADEIEAIVALGRLGRAARLVSMLETAGRRLQRRWALVQAGRCRALLLAAHGDLEQAARAVQEAAAEGETLELRLELARTLLVAGQIERRRRRKAPAREHLERALTIFEAAGAELWVRRVERELDRAKGRAAGAHLTASERRVASLAASGMTNREVATRLFISPKTVEANLVRAYRKLGIHSRAELGARLGAIRGSPQT